MKNKFIKTAIGLTALILMTACSDSGSEASSTGENVEKARISFDELASKLTGEGQARLEATLDSLNLEALNPEQIQERLSEEFENLSGDELMQAVEEYRDQLQEQK